MGRKALYTQDEFFDTADRLAAEGKDVTATALLSELGGGSLTTIYKHLSAWLATRPKTITHPAQIEIPEPVQVAFASAWRTAFSHAMGEASAVKEKAAEEVKMAQRQFQEALDQIARLEREAENDTAQIEKLDGRISELETALHKVESEAAALKASADKLLEHNAAIQKEVEQLRKEKDAAVKESSELRGQAKTLQEQNSKLLARLPEVKKGK